MRLTIIILTIFLINTTILQATEAEQKEIADTHAKVMIKYKIRFIKGKKKIFTDMKKAYEAQMGTQMAKGDMEATMKTQKKIEEIKGKIKTTTEELKAAEAKLSSFNDTDY